jgi:enoyl-CoA hydratase
MSNPGGDVYDDVRTAVHGGIGRITLERPKAMNALTAPMVARVDGALAAWRSDARVDAVLIDGAGERGLCAGGDIKMFHASALGDGSEATAFWAAEYAMNAHIARYPKPVVALMTGAVLGGGVGIGSHARHRVVTDTTSIGLPEVGIGFVPDVGGDVPSSLVCRTLDEAVEFAASVDNRVVVRPSFTMGGRQHRYDK